ncbi:MAG: hypothetical protein JEY97_00300 [Bacteroidales bacterium]|nr:hypothetical protein [Bacteroidales bacterium]
MLKKLFCVFLLIPIGFFSFGQGQTITVSDKQSEKIIKQNDFSKLKLYYNFNEIKAFDIETDKGIFTDLYIDGSYFCGNIGEPKVPAIKNLIEIPFGAEVKIKNITYDVREYKLTDFGIHNLILPVQTSPRKDLSAHDLEIKFNEKFYQIDKFNDKELVKTEVLGILRGIRIARLEISPISYNPQKGIIRVYNNIELELDFADSDVLLTESKKASTFSPYFEVVYNKLLNYKTDNYPAHPDLTKYPVKYLIVCDRQFEEQIQDFIEWKTLKGFEIIIAFTDEIGYSYNEIKTWIHERYNEATPDDPAPSFILLVGDTQQIPASLGALTGKMTDLYYSSVDYDYFPEMYIGRFSGKNQEEIAAQVEKTISYEKYLENDPSFLNNATLIAGVDQTWNPAIGQATIKYGTENYFNQANDFESVNEYLIEYNGCYNTMNPGLSFLTYSAHGTETSWIDPALDRGDVYAFYNSNKSPLVIANCCYSGDFGYSECIGESFLRNPNGGAIAYIGSAGFSQWFEDFYWAVGAFPIVGNNNGYVPSFEETSLGAYDASFVSDYVANDALVFVGNLAVTEANIQGYPHQTSSLFYWQSYNLLGDPSLITYFTEAKSNSVNHLCIFPMNTEIFKVSALAGSYVGISKDGILLGSAFIDENGFAEIPISPVLTEGNVNLVVTKPQHKPYFASLPAKDISDSYLLVDKLIINTPDDTLIEAGETVILSIEVKNIGQNEATGSINSVLDFSDQYINVISDEISFSGPLLPEQSIIIENAFEIEVAENIPDNYELSFRFELIYEQNLDESFSIAHAYAPLLICNNFIVGDLNTNNNGRLDPGETANLIFEIKNEGQSEAQNVNCQLESANEFLIINNSLFEIDIIKSDSIKNAIFNVSLSDLMPSGTSLDLTININTGEYLSKKTFTEKVIRTNEGFESGDFSKFNWEFGGDENWQISSTDPYEGIFCAKSGEIIENQNSELRIDFKVLKDDSISFFRKISCESIDFLKFYIDDEIIDELIGVSDWEKKTYPVSSGKHCFKWVYEKNSSQSSFDDCVWIDNIDFPIPAISSDIQTIDLKQGFQFVSSNVLPEFPDMKVVMDSNLNENLVFIRNSEGKMFRKIGPFWVNGIGDWKISEGYLIKMLNEETLKIYGEKVNPEVTVGLNPGYQFISYFPDNPIDALIAFASILNEKLDFIRSSDGEMLRKIGPNWINGIGECKPGEGYLIKMFESGAVVYPN